MILAEQHRARQPSSSAESTTNSEEVCLNNIDSWQSTNTSNSCSNNSVKKIGGAIVHRQQTDNQKIIDIEDNEDDDNSVTWQSSDEDDENDERKQQNNWVAEKLPQIPQPSVNNQISGSNHVNISNTNKNVYEGNVVIHQTFYNNQTPSPTPCLMTNGIEKITIDKDGEETVGPKLSNISSHPLYPFEHHKVTNWCTRKRLIVISGAVMAGIAIITLIIYFTTTGMKKPTYVPSPPNDTSITNDESNILGVPYVERLKWIAQPPESPPDKLGVYPPSYVIISHTATEPCFTRAECIYTVRYIQTFHIESKGWDDIAYNFLVGGDGAIYEGRGWDVMGAHTFNYNIKSIGISFIGTFMKKEPTEQQIYAARKLIEYALESGKLNKEFKLLGHRQCIKTESPGEVLYNIIKTWPHWSPTP